MAAPFISLARNGEPDSKSPTKLHKLCLAVLAV